MKEAVAEMKQAIEAAASAEIIVDADLRFHQLIGEASQNPLVGVLLDSIADLLRMQRLHYCSVPGAPERAQRYHDEIAKIVALHRPDEAYHAMEAHLRQVMHDVEGTHGEWKLASYEEPGAGHGF
jgi:DNA-binding FadR family transcriptional regulator